jgi:hypothetical protein
MEIILGRKIVRLYEEVCRIQNYACSRAFSQLGEVKASLYMHTFPSDK